MENVEVDRKNLFVKVQITQIEIPEEDMYTNHETE